MGNGNRQVRWLLGRLAVLAAMWGWTARGEYVDFIGTAEPGELSNTANWSASTWGATATQRVNGATATIPATGLKLSAPLAAAGQFKIQNFSSNVAVDFGAEENLNANELYITGNNRKTILLSGNVTNLTSIYLNNNNTVVLTNGIFHLATGDFFCYNWWDEIRIAKGAELVVDKVNKHVGSGSNGQHAGIRIDGGRLTINGYRDANWSLVQHGNNGDNFLEIVNGGVYYEAETAEFAIKGARTHFLIDNGGAYISTNASNAARNMKVGISSGTFAVTNGTIKAAQICGGVYQNNGLGLYNTLDMAPTDTRFTFHNARAAFQFKPTSTYKGSFMLAGKAARNTVLLDGPDNKFDAYYLLLGGKTNTFTVADGKFDAYRMFFMEGVGNKLAFTGGTSVVSNGYSLASSDSVATNATISVSGTAKVDYKGGMELRGKSPSLLVEGGVLNLGTQGLRFYGSECLYEQTGGVVTGRVEFLTDGGLVRIVDGAKHVASFGGDSKNSSILFDAGRSDNVVVISNATFTSRMPLSYGLLKTDEGPGWEAIPFTNCPNCRIELQGDSPSLEVTSNKRYSSDGGSWYSLALGNSHDPGPLRDPLRLKYVLPRAAYAEAPVRVTSATAVLGGNAVLDFDAASFKWPARTTRIPLIYNGAAFKGYGNRLYINVAGLNATNAGRLPECDGIKSYLALSGDGKTLELVVPGNGGTMVIFK